MSENSLKTKGSGYLLPVGILLILIIAVMAYNFSIQANILKSIEKQNNLILLASSQGLTAGSGLASADGGSSIVSYSNVIPTGVPKIYGSELGLKYDDVSADNPGLADQTIAKMAKYDNDTLTGDALNRYIKITNNISCEYCCGAKAITFTDGKPACGCAHSAAMRGLAKYLLQKHPNEFTDDQILEELGKWKVRFFPTIMVAKAKILQEKGIELNYINLASNKYRGIEKGASGGSMVGGC